MESQVINQAEDLSLLVAMSSDLICTTDFEGQFVSINPAWERVLGWSERELRAQCFLGFIHPSDRESTLQEFQRLCQGASSLVLSNRYRCKDGKRRSIRWNCVADPGRRQIYCVGHDISDLQEQIHTYAPPIQQRAAEEALRQAYQMLNGIIEASPHAIIAVDRERNIRLWNPAATRIFGWTDEDVMGGKAPFVNDAQRGASDLFNKRMMAGECLTNFELQRTRRDGAILDLMVSAAPTIDEEGAIDGFLTVATDITEHKQLEQQFFRTQRLESLGTLAGGIAHDLNNVLSPIAMSVELFRMKCTDPSLERVFATVESCTRRAADLIRQILAFARGVKGEHAPLQALHLLQDMEKVIAQTLPKSITVESDLAQDLWMVSADTTQFHQVLMNLCINARDAMSNGGVLSISAKNVFLDKAYIQMSSGPSEGPYVCIEVRDTGCGIPVEIRERIFEPFFTTKDIGKGTGLGLSTVAAILKSHKGFINVHSETGVGTSFTIYLPAQSHKAAEAVAKVKATLPSGSGELVLVVDDESYVRDIVRLTLETHGYKVLEAQDGADGVARYAQNLQDIQIVISDMDMPVMNGAAMIQSLERIDPGVRVISASGLVTDTKPRVSEGHPRRRLLAKPYTAEQLLNTVHELLHAA